jgi:hypothetical protein
MYKQFIVFMVMGLLSVQVNAVNLEDFIGKVLTEVTTGVDSKSSSDLNNKESSSTISDEATNEIDDWNAYQDDIEGLLDHKLPVGTKEYTLANNYILETAERCLLVGYAGAGYCSTQSHLERIWKYESYINSTLFHDEAERWKKNKDYVEAMFKQPFSEEDFVVTIALNEANDETYRAGISERCDYLTKQARAKEQFDPYPYRRLGHIQEPYCSLVINDFSESALKTRKDSRKYDKTKEKMIWQNAQIAMKALNIAIAKNESKKQKEANTRAAEISQLEQKQKTTPVVKGKWQHQNVAGFGNSVGLSSSNKKGALLVSCVDFYSLDVLIDWPTLMDDESIVLTVDGYTQDTGWGSVGKSYLIFDNLDLVRALKNARGNIVVIGETIRGRKDTQIFSPKGSTKMIAEMEARCGY